MKPWLLLPTSLAHALAPLGLEILATFKTKPVPKWKLLRWRGLEFPNRLGLAGGVDKDAENVEAWWKFGAGFVEIGTVTPEPQGPNPGRIIARDIPNQALWNRMGFPGAGAKEVRQNILDLPQLRATPLFINVGKNRETPLEAAADDYVSCMKTLGDLADAWVINISSPNTSGLRELFQARHFKPFLSRILKARLFNTPLLLKLSPDLHDEDFVAVVRMAVDLGVDGFIATNTTLAREPGSKFPAEGGVSGRPLARRSIEALAKLQSLLSPAERERLLLISTGGVMTPADVEQRLAQGADLVQTYTALVYEGPSFFEQVARHFTEGGVGPQVR